MSLTPGKRFIAFSILIAHAPQSIPSMRIFRVLWAAIGHLDNFDMTP